MELPALRRDGNRRLLFRRRDGIPGEERAVAVAKERHVPGAVARCKNPSPRCRPRHRTIVPQELESIANVDWPPRVQTGHERHRAAADERIGRRIG
jgi:hypothetical protein